MAKALKFNVQWLVIAIFVFCSPIADFYPSAEVSDTTMLIKVMLPIT